MKSNLLIVTALILFFTGNGLATEAKKEEVLTKPSPKVQKLIDEAQLEIVDFDYVQNAIGNGTRKGAKALLVDARPNSKYVKGTIPSSLNIPDTKFDEFYSQLDKVDKSKEAIVFCGGWKCGKSPKVAKMLKDKGFTNVKVYQAGQPDWNKKSFQEVDTAVVKAAQENNSAILIDARPYKKYLQATIPGAISIPDTEMDKLSGRFPVSKDERIITFCGGYGCGKSHKVTKKLRGLGYKNVTVYAGGLPKWKADGMSTTGSITKKAPASEKPEKPVMKNGIKLGVDEGTVDGEWFNKLIASNSIPANVQLIDVIPTEDFENGHLKGSVNIYAEALEAKELYEKLPKGKIIVFNCTSGARALEAWIKLQEAKIDTTDIYYFDANISCDKDSKCEIEVNEPLG